MWGPCVWGRGPPSAAPSQEEGARGAGGQLLWGHLVGRVQDHRRARPWGQRLVLLVTVKCREPVGVPGQAHDEGRGQGLRRKPRVRWVAGLTLGPKTLVSLDEGSQGSQF